MTTKHHMDEPLEPPLAEECQRALESWVCEDPEEAANSDAADHIEHCKSCRDLADAIGFDQKILRWQLSRIEPPPAPRLALREPLRSASGHPRRVSLAVLPFLIGLTLVLLLAVELLLGSIQNSITPQIPDKTRAVLQIQRIERALHNQLTPPLLPGATPPANWADQLMENSGGGLRVLEFEEDGFVDPFGVKYRLRVHPDQLEWQLVSAGPDQIFAEGGDPGDDLTAQSLARD